MVDLDVEVIPVSVRGDGDVRAARQIRRNFARLDLVHAHTGHAHGICRLAMVAHAAAPPLVVSRRVDFPIKGGPAGYWKYRRGVSRYVAISDNVKKVLLNSGIPASQISRVHSGVDLTRGEGKADRAGIRTELGLPPETPVVGFIGALVNHKAPQDFIAAMALLPEPVHGVIAGSGHLEDKLRKQTLDLGLENRLHFLGYREDPLRWVASVDIFVLPSRLEGLGTSVLDAMAVGTPVVATRSGGLPEMIEDGSSGLLVDSGDIQALGKALTRVLEDRPLRDQIVAGALDRVRYFSKDRMVDETIQVYKDMLADRAPAGPGRGRGKAGTS